MVTDSNKSNAPPYIVNLFDRENLSEGTIDITHYLTREGFIWYLTRISELFNKINLPIVYECGQVYFIAQDNFEAIKIGITNNVRRRIIELQTGNPNKLIMLFHYDPIKYNVGSVCENMQNLDANGYERNARSWYSGTGENRLMGEWIKPDDRCFRMLIREGLEILEWHRQNSLVGQ